MAELQFPVFSTCKLTINNKISTKDGKLYKLLTDEHQFKIISFDPLVIEKNAPSQQDILELFNALSTFIGTKETSDQTVQRETHPPINDLASSFNTQATQNSRDSLISAISNTSDLLIAEKDFRQDKYVELESEHKISTTTEECENVHENKEVTEFEQERESLTGFVHLSLVDVVELKQEEKALKENLVADMTPVTVENNENQENKEQFESEPRGQRIAEQYEEKYEGEEIKSIHEINLATNISPANLIKDVRESEQDESSCESDLEVDKKIIVTSENNNQIKGKSLESEQNTVQTTKMYKQFDDDEEMTISTQERKIATDITQVNWMDKGKIEQQEKYNCGEHVVTKIPINTDLQQNEREAGMSCSNNDTQTQESIVYSMNTTAFHVAMYYFVNTNYGSYFEHAQTDGKALKFKLNARNRQDVEFLNKIRQLHFVEYRLINTGSLVAKAAIQTVKSKFSGAIMNIVCGNIYIIGSRVIVASALKMLDSLLLEGIENQDFPNSKQSTFMKKDDKKYNQGPYCRDKDENQDDTERNEHKLGTIKEKKVEKLTKNNDRTDQDKDDLDLYYSCINEDQADIERNEHKLETIKSQRGQKLITKSTEMKNHQEKDNQELYSSGNDESQDDIERNERKLESIKSDKDKKLTSTEYTQSSSLTRNESSDYPKPRERSTIAQSQVRRSEMNSNQSKESYLLSCINKFEVKIYKANIAGLSVDCIVSTTNRYLINFGRVATAIQEAAGEAMKQECEHFINAGNSLRIADIFVSSGGNLPVKYIFHAVGPEWDEENKTRCIDDLRRTVLRCLFEAHRRRLTSIALPSIGAAILGVPKILCVRCYVDAVKHFDILVRRNTSVRSIHFVDLDDKMVALNREYFSSNLSRPCDQNILDEDCDFVKNLVCIAPHLDMSSYQANLSTGKVLSIKQLPSQLSEANREMAAARPLKVKTLEMFETYKMGKITLNLESTSALDKRSDLIITIGRPFNKLSELKDFKIALNLKQCDKGLGKKDNIYEFFSVSDPNGGLPHLLCEIYPEPETADQITEAFINLESAINLQNMKALVLTSSFLYTIESGNNEQQKQNTGASEKSKVTKFTQCLLSYLDRSSKDIKDDISISVAGSQNALLILRKVIDSYSLERKVSDLTKMSHVNANVVVTSKHVCEFCGENVHCLPVRCCKKLLCHNCKLNATTCPFCNTFWRIIKGHQPHGYMRVSQINEHADGYEKVPVWEIEYHFPAGIQKDCHPNPGKLYRSSIRTAYLPANVQGLQVLMLLRIAFIRKLTFMIGRSLRRQKDDVIVWTDISHKTKLHGEEYGYPDPNYLDQVTVELASKGVKMENLTELEKLDLANFSSNITNYKRFSDDETVQH